MCVCNMRYRNIAFYGVWMAFLEAIGEVDDKCLRASTAYSKRWKEEHFAYRNMYMRGVFV